MATTHSQNQEKHTQNVKDKARQRKPISFSWRLENKWCRNGVWGVFGLVSVEREMGKIVNSHKKSREKLKKFKKLSLKRKIRIFHNWNKSPTSHQGKPPKHSKSKLWKKFLSVFCDWKVYPQESRKLSCENLCVPLATGPFTREQVTKINLRAHGYSMRLGWPVIESPKQGNIVFEIFQIL